ncbi:MAG: T9SS type A sorting domain-containing protein [Bacteroidales bacterium]
MKAKTYTITAFFIIAALLIHQKAHSTIHQVLVGNFFFNPSSLNVTVGDTVKWVWVAGSHTTTSSSIPVGAAIWDRLINSGSPSFSYKVTVAGTFNYVCTLHAAMGMVGDFTASNPVATLAVTPANQDVSAASGSTTFSVSSNTIWNASCSTAWCSCTPSGNGNGIISLSYAENTSTQERVATISVTASGAPTQTVTLTQAGSTLGLNDQVAENLVIYPNPVRSEINISSESLKTSAEEVTVYDICGKKVLGPINISGSPVSIDASSLREGVYFIRLLKDNTGMIRKIVKTQ